MFWSGNKFQMHLPAAVSKGPKYSLDTCKEMSLLLKQRQIVAWEVFLFSFPGLEQKARQGLVHVMLMGQSQVPTRSWVWAELGQQRKSHRERTTLGVCACPLLTAGRASLISGTGCTSHDSTEHEVRWAGVSSTAAGAPCRGVLGLGAAVGAVLFLLPGVLSLWDLMPGWASLCSAQELCILSFEGEFPSLSYACHPGDNSFLRSCELVCRQASGEHHLPSGNDALLAQFSRPSVSLNIESLNKHYYKENFKHLFPCVV